MSRISKKQDQFNQISKKIAITAEEFDKYYKDVRRANAKGNRLKKAGSVLYAPKFSTELGRVKNAEDFERITNAISNVLTPSYTRRVNTEYRERLYNNVRESFGDEGSKEIISRFDELSIPELIEFFDKNEDLATLPYDSDGNTPEGINSILDFLTITKDSFLDRF